MNLPKLVNSICIVGFWVLISLIFCLVWVLLLYRRNGSRRP